METPAYSEESTFSMLSNEEVKELREKFKSTSSFQHYEFINAYFKKMNKFLTAEQAVYIGTAVESTYQDEFYVAVIEHLSNPHDLIPLINEFKAVYYEHKIEKIQHQLTLLSRMNVIRPAPAPSLEIVYPDEDDDSFVTLIKEDSRAAALTVAAGLLMLLLLFIATVLL